jgi:6-phosphogluconolactonase
MSILPWINDRASAHPSFVIQSLIMRPLKHSFESKTGTRLWLGGIAVLLLVGSVRAEQAVIWIGTTTPREGDSKGIYRATMDLQTGDVSRPVLAAKIGSPGFVTLHPGGRQLYSVCQLPDGGGGVAAFEISADLESLELLNTQPTRDGGAAHLAVDRTGRCLYTAQYGGGSVAVFPLAPNGSILPRSDLQKHEGSGPNAARQDGPHPHWVGVGPTNRFLFVPDLGIDQVVIYRMDLAAARIQLHGRGHCPAGGGPRHMKFHPSGKFAYVLNELELSVTAFAYDPEAGTMQPIHTISTLPAESREVPNKASEIRIHPSGRFLYAANRGHDSIAAFQIGPTSGRLTFIEREAIRGSWPRNFNLDPSGTWLLAAGRDSHTITVFRINEQSGGLIYTGKTVNCPTPICVEVQLLP